MAKLLPNNKIIGSIGNVSFRGFTKGTILQSKPGKGGVKQTKNTKKSASNFGRCSSAAALMVRSWQSVILQYQDTQMAYKFRSALYHSMLAPPLPPGSHRSLQHATLSDLNGFEFNSHTPFATYCRIPIHISLTATKVLQLTVESCNASDVVQWPANAQKATLCLLVNNPFVPTTETNSHMVQLPIANRNATIDEQTFEIELAPHTPAVAVTACLLYYNAMLHHTPVCLNHKQLHPAALLYCDTIA